MYEWSEKWGLMMTEDEFLCKNLCFLRKRTRLSLYDFADYVGICSNMLYCIEKGNFNAIPGDALENVCKLFQISVDDLLLKDLEEMGYRRPRTRKAARKAKQG